MARPVLGNPSKYLLTNLALCGCCGGPLKARSRSHGNGRKHFYGCSWFHERGRRACTNNADVPMVDANDIVIEALLDDILDQTIVEDAVTEALRLLRGEDISERTDRLETELRKLSQERDRLVAAIAAGGELQGLVDALSARDQRRAALEAQRDTIRAERRLTASEAARVKRDLLTLADNWRTVLSEDISNARPIVTSLLKGRVTITPKDRQRWELRGEGHLAGLFTAVFPFGMASPTGGIPEWTRDILGEAPAAGSERVA